MDWNITGIVMAMNGTFVLSQMIVHRLFSQQDVIRLLKICYGVSVLTTFVLFLAFVWIYQKPLGSDMVLSFGMGGGIGTLWLVDYVTGLFGLPVSSLRIRQLTDIYHAGAKGIPQKQLLAQYGKTEMVRMRLERLVTSGEVEQRKNRYYVINTASYLRLHAFLHRTLRSVYLR